MALKKWLPVLEWLPQYQKGWFRHDLVAGLTVGVMLVPQGMAYALLAGMPPIYGLYASLIPLLLYAIFGTSRQISIGPVAVDAFLVLAGLSLIAEPQSPEYISLVILTGLAVGVLQLILSLLRLGFLVNFLSHPVVSGFTSAAAVIIAVSQLKYLLGIRIPRFNHVYQTFYYALTHLSETHWITLVMSIAGIALILLLKKLNKNIPGALIAVILGILITWIWRLDQHGLDTVGVVPRGLPHFEIPDMSWQRLVQIFPTVLAVSIIGIVESVGIAKSLESKHRSYVVVPNQELLALGVSKIGGAFFQSLVTSGSFTRSAVNNDSGAKTQLSSVITMLVIVFTLIFMTGLFYYLPNAILAAIIMLATKSLFDYQGAIRLWHVHRHDFYMMILTFLVTLLFGIEEGVLAGVLLSIAMVIYRSSLPHMAILGRLPESTHYRNVTRFPEALQENGVVIIRFDAPLYFGNSTYFKDTIRQIILQQKEPVKALVLDASSISDLDTSGLEALESVINQMHANQVDFMLAGVIGPVRDILYKAGLRELIGKDNLFLHVQQAIDDYHNRMDERSERLQAKALQTNVRARKSDPTKDQ
ncbi:MAG TPA: solute carrier family 26 protein [Saprospiraceae bacterium]|nr:solute carrier family 26 protein [Saprospiraceae bacterium]HRV85207.1 solute carrier family 26 protein [Saprospiraceae bacterium]